MNYNNSAVKNRVLGAQAREIIYSVWKFTQNEATVNKALIDFFKVQKRVAALTGVSMSTVKRITQEGREIEAGERIAFTKPTKRKKKSSKIQLNDIEREVLRQHIHNLLEMTNDEMCTIRKIHRKFQEEMNYKGCRESMRREIHALGFRWKTVNNKKVLIEKHLPTNHTATTTHLDRSDPITKCWLPPSTLDFLQEDSIDLSQDDFKYCPP